MSTSPKRTPTSVAAHAVSRKYRRQRARPSPLSDHVKRRLLSKLKSTSDQGPPSVTNDCVETITDADEPVESQTKGELIAASVCT